jgi:hypothetical protein
MWPGDAGALERAQEFMGEKCPRRPPGLSLPMAAPTWAAMVKANRSST